MDYKLLIILLAFLGSFYSILLNLFRMRSARNPIPECVRDIYSEEDYLKWKSYNFEHTRLNVLSEALNCAVTLVFLALDVFAGFASLFPKGEFGEMMGVVILLSAVSFVLETFTGYFSVMVIEEKYGFNRTTLRTFVFDRIRSLVISFGLTMLLAVGIWCFHGLVGNFMAPVFVLAMLIVSLVITFLYPALSRIGNKFTPLPEGELRDKLVMLLNSHGYRVNSISVMDASRRTTKADAYITGFGKLKTIVIYDNLINAFSEDEICAVFAHELGHGIHRDVFKSQFFAILNYTVIGLVAWGAVSMPALHLYCGFAEINYGFAFFLVGLALAVLSPLLSIFSSWNSRRAEYRADRQAVEEGYGEAMVRALKILAKSNFANLAPSRLVVALEYDHPPIHARIEAIEAAIKEKEAKGIKE